MKRATVWFLALFLVGGLLAGCKGKLTGNQPDNSETDG